METSTTTHTLRRIDAAPGHVLIDRDALAAARAAADTEPAPGSVAPYTSATVYLGAADSADRYTEITDAEAAAIAARYAPAPEPRPAVEDVEVTEI